MQTKTSRLEKVKKAIKPPKAPRALDIFWEDVETGEITHDGETMTRAEYEKYKRDHPGPEITWIDNEGV